MSSDPVTILMADDDADDRMFAREAWDANQMVNRLRFVEDGEELMDYLQHRGQYTLAEDAPRPGLILLDLNMPRKDGRAALSEIRADQDLRHIPVVILTASKAEKDVYSSYDSGANSFINKPVTFEALVKVIYSISAYWLDVVQLPAQVDRRKNG